MRVAADDLRGDRGLDVGQVEHAGLGRQLGVEDDLEEQVAELLGECRRRRPPRARRRPRRPPRAGGCAATRGSARGPTGSRPAAAAGPRSRASPRGWRRPAPAPPGRGTAGARRAASVSSADRDRGGRPEPADRVVGRDRAAREHVERPSAPPRPVPTRAAARPASATADGRRRHPLRPEDRRRHDQDRPRWLERRRDERFGRDDLEAGGEVESPAEPCLGDERVEHRRPPLAAPRGSRVIVTAAFLPAVPVAEASLLIVVELSASGVAVLFGDDLEQVQAAVVRVGHDGQTSCRSRSRRWRPSARRRAGLRAIQPRSPPRAASGPSELSRASGRSRLRRRSAA